MGCNHQAELAEIVEATRVRSTQSTKERAAAFKRMGDFSEAVVEVLLQEVLDMPVIHSGLAAGAHQGIDTVVLDGTTLTTVEVKSSGVPTKGRPSMGSTTRSGKQGSAEYIAARADAAGIGTVTAADVRTGAVSSMAVMVNVATDTIAAFAIAPDGTVGQHAEYSLSLSDLATYCDAVSGDRG